MNEILAPNDGATNLGLVDGINEGLACVRALTMAINPRNLDPESIEALASMAFTVSSKLEEKVDALLLRLGAIKP